MASEGRHHRVSGSPRTETIMIAIKNILVATDFGPASDTALRYGRALASRFGARLHVLHVTENIYLTAGSLYGYGYTSMPPNIQQEIEAAAAKQTAELLTDEERRTQQGIAVTVPAASPAAAIADYARRHDIDLAVLGTHGRGAVSHLLMGSVAERVVRTAPCPVLTVRDPQHEFVLPDAIAEHEGVTP
jgi:nucleotide-binding universal stress UspA family protein